MVSATTQLKIEAPDGKKRISDSLDSDGIIALTKKFSTNQVSLFLDWFTNSDNTIDGKSK